MANQTNSDIYSKNGKYKESIILYRSASQTQQLVQSLLKTNIPFVLEADSPYEGIFGIKSFQHFYQKIVHWQTALNLQRKIRPTSNCSGS